MTSFIADDVVCFNVAKVLSFAKVTTVHTVFLGRKHYKIDIHYEGGSGRTVLYETEAERDATFDKAVKMLQAILVNKEDANG